MNSDVSLVLVSCAGIALAVWLIAKVGLHPFVGLLTSALAIGLLTGSPPPEVAAAIEKGFADILKSTGLVVALGLGLGAILQLSGGAQALAAKALALTGPRHARWGALLAALLIGLPLFFETGVVLLLPIIAAGIAAKGETASLRLTVMLSALAGLSVLHALLPPHPGPLIALGELGAPLGRTMVLGALAAIPTALIAGPLLARFTTRGVQIDEPSLAATPPLGSASAWRALAVLIFPVILIAAGAVLQLEQASGSKAADWVRLLSEPPVALLLANLLGLAVLFGPRAMERNVQSLVWTDAVHPAGSILLSIGAGGSLKQVLVTAQLPELVSTFAATAALSPVILAWLVSASIRVATGSATVATITAAAIMSAVAAHHQVDPSFMVLAIGAGSVFLSHVNDPGFWLVKGYLGTSTRDTFRTWSALETAISVVGLTMILALQAVTSRI